MMKGMDDPTPLNKLVASEIRAWLGRRQITGRQLAARIGASQTWTATRLRGEQEISLNDLQRIAAALDVEVAELLPAPTTQGRRLTGSSPIAVMGPTPTHPSGHIIRSDRHPRKSATQPTHTTTAPVVHHRPARLSRPRTRPADAASPGNITQ